MATVSDDDRHKLAITGALATFRWSDADEPEEVAANVPYDACLAFVDAILPTIQQALDDAEQRGRDLERREQAGRTRRYWESVRQTKQADR